VIDVITSIICGAVVATLSLTDTAATARSFDTVAA
jgi:hypothetical protein